MEDHNPHQKMKDGEMQIFTVSQIIKLRRVAAEGAVAVQNLQVVAFHDIYYYTFFFNYLSENYDQFCVCLTDIELFFWVYTITLRHSLEFLFLMFQTFFMAGMCFHTYAMLESVWSPGVITPCCIQVQQDYRTFQP